MIEFFKKFLLEFLLLWNFMIQFRFQKYSEANNWKLSTL